MLAPTKKSKSSLGIFLWWWWVWTCMHRYIYMHPIGLAEKLFWKKKSSFGRYHIKHWQATAVLPRWPLLPPFCSVGPVNTNRKWTFNAAGWNSSFCCSQVTTQHVASPLLLFLCLWSVCQTLWIEKNRETHRNVQKQVKVKSSWSKISNDIPLKTGNLSLEHSFGSHTENTCY